MKRLISIILLLAAPFSYANCKLPVTYVKEGQPAECSGYLFTIEKEAEVRLIKDQLDNLQAEMDIRNKQIEIYTKDFKIFGDIQTKQTQEVELFRNAAQDATSKYIASQNDRFIRDLLCFGAGIALILLGSFVVKNVK